MRYLITGGAGYLGAKLVSALAARKGTTGILIADLRPPRLRPPMTGFRKVDVRDAAALNELVQSEQPDVLIHLAFVVDPTHDEPAMYDVNVNGAFNVLSAASSAGVGQVLFMSAAMAYGAWPDNPTVINESRPVHGHAHYMYARHKAEADRIAQLWATLHPDRTMTIVRPCTIFGEGADNHFVRMWEGQPFFPDFGGTDHGTQFIDDNDAIAAIVGLIAGKHAGVFNLASDGEISWRQCAELAGIEVRSVREESFTSFASGMWRLKIQSAEIPPSFVDFFKHPWQISNVKIKHALPEWSPQHSSRTVFERMIQERQRALAAGGPGIR